DQRACTGARIGADRAVWLEIAEDVERVRDVLMRLLARNLAEEADAAGILLQRKIVEAFGRGAPVMLARRHLMRRGGRFRGRRRRQCICHDVFALEFGTAHFASSHPTNAVDLTFRPARLFPRAAIASVKSKTALRPICSSVPPVLPFAKEIASNRNVMTRTVILWHPWA